MRPKAIVAILVGVFVIAGGAQAQDGKPAEPKGVKTRGLVTSLGPVGSIPVTVPVALTGQVIEIAPGGQTGKQRNLTPSFLYVLEGTLVIDTEGGPGGVSGIQYHSEGQSYAGPASLWYNVMNTGQKPARFLLIFVAPPGAKTVEQAKGDD